MVLFMITNDWYNDLLDVESGWNLVPGTWCVLASMVFYLGDHAHVVDRPGVYSIAIALMGAGLVMRMLHS